jgi:phage baseplate assembly protein W
VNQYYDPTEVMWPDLRNRQGVIKPVRVGMDRKTGKLLMGQPHADQSVKVIFATRFHERVLRRWVGSFVPHILGDLIQERVISRFYWAIATSLDLWEPNYRVHQVNVSVSSNGMRLNSPETIRMGELTVKHISTYRPRGHLGDTTPENRGPIGLVYGNGIWS